MEEVSSPSHRKSACCAFHRVLKEEYNRTQNRVIGKAQFPGLLKKLWKTDAVGKTNIVKSFMKAGVFPLNSQAVDRSRVLKSKESAVSSSNARSINHVVNSRNTMTTAINPKDSHTDDSVRANAQAVASSTSSISRVAPRFFCSRHAISYLDQVLQQTTCSDEDDGGSDSIVSEQIDEASSDDNDVLNQYIPSQSAVRKRKHSQSKQASTGKTRRRVSPEKGRISAKQARKMIGFDTSDEEGAGSLTNSLCCGSTTAFLFSRKSVNARAVRSIRTITSSDQRNPAIDFCIVFKWSTGNNRETENVEKCQWTSDDRGCRH